MTEREWWNCKKPLEMLKFLSGKASNRKLRLFACACCRRVWEVLTEGGSRSAIEVNERFADGEVEEQEVIAKQAEAWEAWENQQGGMERGGAYWCVQAALRQRAALLSPANGGRTIRSEEWVMACARVSGGWDWEENPKGRRRQAELLQDILGYLPFRSIPASPLLRKWNDGTIVKLGQAAYNERKLPRGYLDPERLAILADALEDAGCTDLEILGHLRSPGPHVRGCWPVDWILGRE